jgi:Domain of unknown function (DUF4160)
MQFQQCLYNPSALVLCQDILVPTVLRFSGLRVTVYPNDQRPAHVHVIGKGCEARFQLNCPFGPIVLLENFGFRPSELRHILNCLSIPIRPPIGKKSANSFPSRTYTKTGGYTPCPKALCVPKRFFVARRRCFHRGAELPAEVAVAPADWAVRLVVAA